MRTSKLVPPLQTTMEMVPQALVTAAMGPQTSVRAQDPWMASTALRNHWTSRGPPTSPPPTRAVTSSLLLEGQEQPWIQDIFLWLPAVVSGKAKSRSDGVEQRAVTGHLRKKPVPAVGKGTGCCGRVDKTPRTSRTRPGDPTLEAQTTTSNSEGNHHFNPSN